MDEIFPLLKCLPWKYIKTSINTYKLNAFYYKYYAKNKIIFLTVFIKIENDVCTSNIILIIP